MRKSRLIPITLLALLLLFLASGALAASTSQSSVNWQVLSAGGASGCLHFRPRLPEWHPRADAQLDLHPGARPQFGLASGTVSSRQ